MSNKKQNLFEEVNWSEIQKKYFDALKAYNSPNPFSGSSNTPADSFWVNAMDHWWKSIKSESGYENETLFEKVIDQCRNYYFMSEQFSGLVEGMANSKLRKHDLNSFINSKFKDIESMFSGSQTNLSWSSLFDACEQPYELMKTSLANMSLDSGGLFNNISPDIRKFSDQVLSMPGVGYSRETQDKIQEAIKLWANYLDNYHEYHSVMTKLNHDALEKMRKKILRMTKKGEEINSMRQIYDLWVESNEKVYNDYVFTEEYSELNGRLVNSLMAFKKQSHEITEDTLSAMNMPTSSDMNELERRHYELRKQVKKMEFEIRDLQKQLKGKDTQTVSTAKKTKPASRTRTRKKSKKISGADNSRVVQFKQSKKKTRKGVKSEKKNVKEKNSSASDGMIEIKF
jgi:poly[(R)-3-hydroxyalkanoate] polymerase subunit PhaE